MTRARLHRALATCTMLALVACGGQRGAAHGSAPTRTRSDVITAEEINRAHWSSAFELIESLHPRWLSSRGSDTILGAPTEVQVHLNESRLGGIQTLRGITVTGIVSIQFVDPVSAAGRWGADHSNGAILISTRQP